MTTNVDHQVDQMVLISQYYPGVYTQLVQDKGEVKPQRRRRKKNKEASSCGLRKRKLTEDQVTMLEQSFEDEHKLESERKDRLASELGLDHRQVTVWFQNRRARWKAKKLEEEYSKLKNQLDATAVEKCLLQTEVLNLEGRLAEADKEIQRLLESSSINSPNSSSLSVEVIEQYPQFLGEFGMEGFKNAFYLDGQNSYAAQGFEWVHHLYDM